MYESDGLSKVAKAVPQQTSQIGTLLVWLESWREKPTTKAFRKEYAKDDGMKETIQNDLDEPLRSYDQLLNALSEHSTQSIWIERVVQMAFELEAQRARRVLFPIRIDDTIRHAKATWATDLHRLRQMEDFHDWEQQERYQQAVNRLVSHLNVGVHQEKT